MKKNYNVKKPLKYVLAIEIYVYHSRKIDNKFLAIFSTARVIS